MDAYNMNQYQQNQIRTASPEQILLMLYDGAIRFTERAITGIEENKPELRRSGISRAIAIITEFSDSLDHEIGGEIAEGLDALYSFMVRELISCNIDNDLEKLKVVKKLLLELRQTWGEAVDLHKKEMVSGRVSQSQTITEQPVAIQPDLYKPIAIAR